MPRIRYGELDLSLEPDETTLEALRRGGAEVASSCRAGVCQACMLRATAGDPGPAAQQGLTPALREQGYFLACVSRPAGDLVIADGAAPAMAAEIVEVVEIGAGVSRVRVRTEQDMVYRPGQYVQVVRDDNLVRAYSLASLPGDDRLLELHVRVHPHGKMSRWLSAAAPGARLSLRGPAGTCFYTEGRPDQPLLLAGTGTGLAPLWAIVRDALSRGHRGPITLVHGAVDASGFYMVAALQEMAGRLENFRYVRCALSGEPGDGVEIGELGAVVKRVFPAINGARVFLCGNPELVASLKKQCFMGGASMRDISADPFLSAVPPT